MHCPAQRRQKIAKVLTVGWTRILIENCCGGHFLELREAESMVRNRGPKPADEIRPLVLPSIMFYRDKQYLLVAGGGIAQFGNLKTHPNKR